MVPNLVLFGLQSATICHDYDYAPHPFHDKCNISTVVSHTLRYCIGHVLILICLVVLYLVPGLRIVHSGNRPCKLQ